MDVPVTLVGNVVNDPEPRTTQAGLVVTTFRLASTPRRFDRALGEFKDGETLFISVSCWRTLARNVAASLRKGDGVIVHGRLIQRNFEKDSVRRSLFEVDALAIGPDLTRGVARPERPLRTSQLDPAEPSDPQEPQEPQDDEASASGDAAGATAA